MLYHRTVMKVCCRKRKGLLPYRETALHGVPRMGFEPIQDILPHAPQTCVSTKFHHLGG